MEASHNSLEFYNLSFQALAIGYSSGAVYIVDIEDKEILDKYDLEQENLDEFVNSKHFGITCITWAVRADTLEGATDPNIYVCAIPFIYIL